MRNKIFSEIVLWIEENLNKNISAEDLESVSGYCARHVSSLFHRYTGLSSGRYIRQRRLCRAAYLLRLTEQKIIDIACQLHFDSQQSFSREFRKLFGCSPRKYRQSADWDFSALLPPYVGGDAPLPDAEFCTLPDRCLYGYAVNYHDMIMEPQYESNVLRYDAVIKNLRYCQRDIIMSTRYRPATGTVNSLDIQTFIGVDNSPVNSRMLSKKHYCAGGDYLRLRFRGTWDEYATFSRRVYLHVLPAMNIIRRDGDEIEHFFYEEGENEHQILNCIYYIPVIRV